MATANTLDGQTLADARDVVIAALADAGSILTNCEFDLGRVVGSLADGAVALYDLGCAPGLRPTFDPTSAAVRRTVGWYRDETAAIVSGPDDVLNLNELQRADRVLAALGEEPSS